MARILPSGAAFGRRIPTPGPGPVAPVAKVGPKEMLEGLQLVEAVAGSQAVGAILKGLGWVGEQAYDKWGELMAPDLSEAATALSAKGVSLEELKGALSDTTAGDFRTPHKATPGVIDRIEGGRAVVEVDDEGKSVDAFLGPLARGAMREGTDVESVVPQHLVDAAKQSFAAGRTRAQVRRELEFGPQKVSPYLISQIINLAQPSPTGRHILKSQIEERVGQFLRDGGSNADAIATMIDRGATPDEARQIVQSAMAQIAETAEPDLPPHQAEVMAALQQGVDPAEILDALVKRKIGDEPADVLTMAARREEAQAVIDEARGALGPAASAELMAREEEVAAVQVGGYEEALALAGSARTPDERAEALRMAVRHAPKRTLLDMIFPEASQIAAAKSAEALMPREFRPERELTELEREDIASKIARRGAITEENKAKGAKLKAETDEIVRKADRDTNEQEMRTARYLAETKKMIAQTKKYAAEAKALAEDSKVKVDFLKLQKRLESPIRALEARIRSARAERSRLVAARIKAKAKADVVAPTWGSEVPLHMRKSMQAQVDVERGRAVQAVNGYNTAINSIDELLRETLDPALTRLQGLKTHAGIDAYLGVSPAAEDIEEAAARTGALP